MINEDELSSAIEKLYFWQHSRTECFTDKLYDLIAKADQFNRNRLRLGFTHEVAAFEMWEQAGNYGEDLFVMLKIKTPDESGVTVGMENGDSKVNHAPLPMQEEK